MTFITRLPLIALLWLVVIGVTSWCPTAKADDPACLADLDENGVVDVNDVLTMIGDWGNPYGVDQLLAALEAWGPVPDDCDTGPTLSEPFHMPTMTDTSTLDVVVVEDWHVDTIDGTTRQKLIDIHVDVWWDDIEIVYPSASSFLLRERSRASSSTARG